MGLVGKLLSFIRLERNGAKVSDVKVDPGGGSNVTLEHFSAPGDDSQPLPGDYVTGVPIPGSGRSAAVGYIDPVNTPKAREGEKRIYARFPDGSVSSELWMQNDETATMFNAAGYWRLTPSGILELNGAADFAIRFNAMQSAFNELRTEINAAIDVFNAHVHPDPVSGTTGVPTTTQTDATADMTAAKVDEVQLP